MRKNIITLTIRIIALSVLFATIPAINALPLVSSTGLAPQEAVFQEGRIAIGGEPIAIQGKDLNGRTISLEQYKGKVVLIDFWATWCPPCRAEIPNVAEVYKKYKDRGFEVIGVSLDREVGKLESYVKKNGINWPQIYDGVDKKYPIARAYRVASIPYTVLIGRDGKIVAVRLRAHNLEESVVAALK